MISDPRALKALAHPHRMAALDELSAHGPLTATECAAAVGTTPSAMSYHLRELARWGFVERVEPAVDGRERPWRAVPGVGATLQLDDPDVGPAAMAAADSVTREVLDRTAQRLAALYTRQASQPAEWRQADLGMLSSDTWLTADEAREFADLRAAFLTRVQGRTATDRPGGSRRVRVVTIVVPLELD
jgi:DNA-binding transcriptional ArsR family regulator